jgi:hypothetical protein
LKKDWPERKRVLDLSQAAEGLPIMQEWKKDPLLDFSEVFGGDSGFSFSGKDNMNIPAFLRNRR